MPFSEWTAEAVAESSGVPGLVKKKTTTLPEPSAFAAASARSGTSTSAGTRGRAARGAVWVGTGVAGLWTAVAGLWTWVPGIGRRGLTGCGVAGAWAAFDACVTDSFEPLRVTRKAPAISARPRMASMTGRGTAIAPSIGTAWTHV